MKEFEMPDEFWVIQGSHSRFHVSDKVAEEIRTSVRQVQNVLAKNPSMEASFDHEILTFDDIQGSEVVLPINCYYGMYRTTKESRRNDCIVTVTLDMAWNKTVKEHKDAEQSWE